MVEFGEPIHIAPEWLEQYKAGGTSKRQACTQLIDMTFKRLKSITVTASDYDTLMVIQAARRLYSPLEGPLDVGQSVDLTRQFALVSRDDIDEKGYDKYKDQPVIKEFAEKVKR